MTFFLAALFSLIALCLLVPCLIFCGECLVGSLPSKRRSFLDTAQLTRPSATVVVPAHNEAVGIAQTLMQIQSQLLPRDRVLVVADNCTDDTAVVARQAGAQVLERHNPTERGKGYALRFALDALAIDPPEIVVFIDADCRLAPNCLYWLITRADGAQSPIQADYRMLPAALATPADLVSAFAFQVKNSIRPRGLQRLGLPCLLMGTGMALPWRLANEMQIDHGNIVEDMQLAVDLAIAGHLTQLCEVAAVESDLPVQRSAVRTQRTRWEHGHLRTLLTQVPRLLGLAVLQRNWKLVVLALDISVPPLALLVAIVTCGLVAGMLFGSLSGNWFPAAILLSAWCALALGVSAAWLGGGQEILPFNKLAAIPGYIMAKLQIYWSFLWRPQTAWVRTGREEAVIDTVASGQPVNPLNSGPSHANILSESAELSGRRSTP